VIEFESLGCRVKNTRRFYVVNPTATGYEFEWKPLEEDKMPMGAIASNYFKCLTPKGVVLSGKKHEMVFEYNPDQVGSHESYWSFEIPGEKVVQYFVAAGTVIEPKIIFNVGKVNFGPLLV
jgi:hydrocephalus-inducing protein